MFYSVFLVPSEILWRGPLAVKAYNNALMDGKAYIKRVPVMLIGQDRTGKTSLKKSLKGELFNAEESSTEGIETDPSHFKVSTEIWKTGQKNNETDSESKFLFDHHVAELIIRSLRKRKPNSLDAEHSSVTEEEPSTSHVDLPVSDPKVNFKHSEERSVRVGSRNVVFDKEETEERDRNLFVPKLPEDIATLVEKLIINDEKVKDDDEIYSVLWDFGGQSVYYATHPIFLTEKAIYILACDLSRNPHEKANAPVRQGLYKNNEDIFCSKTNLDYLDFWMSSVYSLVNSDGTYHDTAASRTTLPPVFLVCTHADEPYCGTDARELALEIYGFLRTKTYRKHLFKDVFVVDNTKSGSENECPEVVRLRGAVLDVAKNLPQMKEAVPLKWLRYENILQLLSKEAYKWISYKEARQIASDECGIDDDEQFQTLLAFLHDQRVLIHFNETPELRNMVILDPQWLIDVFKKVITIKRYKHTEETVEELWLKLEKTGILDERLLHHAWQPLFDSQETYKSLLAIMERFSLLCSWPSHGVNKQYLVPSMLMSPPTEEVLELLDSAQTPSLFVRFESGRVPPGLFSRLVLQFYQWCKEEWKSSLNPELSLNFALFHMRPDQGTSVIFVCHSSSIEIVFHSGDDSVDAGMAGFTHGNFDPTTCRGIHWQLRLILECMSKEFGWLKSMKFEMCVCCPVCSQRGTVRCRTHDVRGCECLHLLSESELLECQYCTRPGFHGDCRIRILMFEHWFAFSDAQENRVSRNQVGS